MTRRRTISIGLASALGCSLVLAQTAGTNRQRRIGVLALNSDRFPSASERPLARFLRTRGWVEASRQVL